MNLSTPAVQSPVILGRPFLATSNALINCRSGLLKLSFGNMTLDLNMFKACKQPPETESIHEISVVEDVSMEEILSSSELIDELETLDHTEEEIAVMGVDHRIERGRHFIEPLPPRETRLRPSDEKFPELELKPLPSELKYAYLGPNESFPVVISSSLTMKQEDRLLEVLRKHKGALGWTIADIKGINPLECTHRIYLEEGAKTSTEPQRRLNPTMKEVVKNEVLKLLEVGIIYPISDSKWVSPTQVVPKKSGVTVIRNEKGELVPTRTVSGWRMCIDYRKLNAATRKDHFPLPFLDQVLEKVAGHEFYCFLDGFSGYYQIAIAP